MPKYRDCKSRKFTKNWSFIEVFLPCYYTNSMPTFFSNICIYKRLLHVRDYIHSHFRFLPVFFFLFSLSLLLRSSSYSRSIYLYFFTPRYIVLYSYIRQTKVTRMLNTTTIFLIVILFL